MSNTPDQSVHPDSEHFVFVRFTVTAESAGDAHRLVRDTLSDAGAPPAEDTPGPLIRGWTMADDYVLPPTWEPFVGSPIPDLVVKMFPPMPKREQFRRQDETIDEDAYDHADEQWRYECLELAIDASHLPQLLDQLDQLEDARQAGIPSDLLAITVLRQLVDQPTQVTDPLFRAREREKLAVLLASADPDVRIPDPSDPNGPEIYEGPASLAHQWIPPGAYRATAPHGQGEFRVLVGHCRVGDATTTSAAFPPADHDRMVLNQIAQVLENAPRHADPGDLLARIDTLITGTGRTGGNAMTLLERDVVLSDLLEQREQHLHPEPKQGPDRPEDPEMRR